MRHNELKRDAKESGYYNRLDQDWINGQLVVNS